MQPRIKFFILPPNYYEREYQHESVSLAEGFRELGILFYGTTDYWWDPDRKQFLIQKAPDEFVAEIHVYNQNYLYHFPEEVRNVDYSVVNILIDVEDGLYSAYTQRALYEKFDLILKAHYTKNINYSYYHKNIQPWAFGLSERIMQQIDSCMGVPVEKQVLINYRISHSLRSIASARFSPGISGNYELFKYTTDTSPEGFGAFTEKDLLFWKQTNQRHDPQYFKWLNKSLLTYAFGGFTQIKPFATNRLVRQLQSFFRIKAAVLSKLGQDTSSCYFIYQYDSWRLWESFYSQSCPVHMDFEDWGFVLPVMPVNKVHYWGVKRLDFEKSAEELVQLKEETIKEMGLKGRAWVKENYGPKAVAARFLKTVETIKLQRADLS
jgi:hypothetical protein